MKSVYSISIFHDKRRLLDNGKYPVKLRVYTSSPRRQRLYKTDFTLTENEFKETWENSKPKGAKKELKLQLQALENRAYDIARDLNPFTFDAFDRKIKRSKNEGLLITNHYSEVIAELKNQKRLSTASSYQLSLASIQRFVENDTRAKLANLSFLEIDEKWLNAYEQFHLNEEGKSLTTIGIYLRNLRAIFNKAISEKELEEDHYPFGKRKYQIPTSPKVKKALSSNELKILFNADPKHKDQRKARDFWFLSFVCSGINIKDIALLKQDNIDGDHIRFSRAKTRLTGKSNPVLVSVPITSFFKKVLIQYGNTGRSKSEYLFKIIQEGDSAEVQKKKIANFTRYINQHIKNLSRILKLPTSISTNWARHSYATTSIKKGQSMEFVQESLGHKSLNTTRSYFAGFDDETKKNFAESLTDF